MLMDKSLIREFARSMEKLALNIDPALVGALLGGGLGGAAGYYRTRDPRHKIRNMLLAGGAGALGGALIGSRFAERPSPLSVREKELLLDRLSQGERKLIDRLAALEQAGQATKEELLGRLSAAERGIKELARSRAAGLPGLKLTPPALLW